MDANGREYFSLATLAASFPEGVRFRVHSRSFAVPDFNSLLAGDLPPPAKCGWSGKSASISREMARQERFRVRWLKVAGNILPGAQKADGEICA